ncbi:EndoU domain-containing protein [Priestia aryabhattai]|uniref:EndoU domain-containing protein n=3 Tax=Bacillaceae TaxID=186817 RepID=UPI003D26F818
MIKEVGLEKLIQLQAMTPTEQLKEIHRLEKTSPYIREVLTQVQQDTAPANMKKLAELSPAEQAVELEKSPYLQALNDSSTVGMLASQQVLQNATGVEGTLMQSVMSVGTKKETTSPKKLTIQQKEKQVIKTVGLKQLKELEMMHPLDQKKKLEQLEKKAPHVKEVFKHIQKENSPKVQRDLAALSHSKAKLEKELKKYPYLYENYKKPEIARSVYEEEAKKQQQDGLAAVSFVADMVPVVSNVKGGWEASVGYDPITGNELSRFDRSVSGAGIVFGGFARVPGKVVKYGSEGAEYVLRVNKAEKTVTKHKVKDVSKGTGNNSKPVSGAKSIITPEMEEKILLGQRKNPNKNEIIGGHSSNINNSHSNYVTEAIKINPDGTKDIKYITQFPDGNLSKIKNSTIFPEGWSDIKILDSITDIGNSPPISIRGRDGATFHRGIVEGVEIDVIKIGDMVVSGYPTGQINAPLPGGFSK